MLITILLTYVKLVLLIIIMILIHNGVLIICGVIKHNNIYGYGYMMNIGGSMFLEYVYG